MAALRQKQAHENELDRIAGTRLTLETQVSCLLKRFQIELTVQVNAIESANLNAETMVAMKKGADALKGIHSSLYVSSFRLVGSHVDALAKSKRSTRRWTASGNRWTLRTRYRMPFRTRSEWATWSTRWVTALRVCRVG